MFSNGAYSAEKGYDLRTSHNVPMGEIRSMRYVAPFSTSSLQKNTITYSLEDGPPTDGFKCTVPSPLIPPTVTTSHCTYTPKYDWNTRNYYLGVGPGFNQTPSKSNIMRVVEKKFSIK